MKKLWKVTVNNWGWDSPRTYYCESRNDCLKIYRRFPAADPIKYAGMFTEGNANELVCDVNEVIAND